MKRNNRKVIILTIVVLLLFVLFIKSYSYDELLMDICKDIRSTKLTFWMLFITNFGSALTFLIIALFGMIVLNYKKGLNILYVLISSSLVSVGIKYLLKRPRPISQFITETGYSFPSAHTLVSTALYGYLIYLIMRSNAKKGYKILFSIIAFLIIILVGFSRIYLGVHYTSDVFGGFLFGVILLILFIYITNNGLTIKDEKIRLDHSFKYAFSGVKQVIINERNMQIHLLAVFSVIVCGIYFDISNYEWFTCLILFTMVLTAEIFNTVIENTIDYISEKKCVEAKVIKDMAAGAVLITAITAFVIGLVIFIPKIIAIFI